MILVHKFESDLPQYWPEYYPLISYVEEDGSPVLTIVYNNATFANSEVSSEFLDGTRQIYQTKATFDQHAANLAKIKASLDLPWLRMIVSVRVEGGPRGVIVGGTDDGDLLVWYTSDQIVAVHPTQHIVYYDPEYPDLELARF